MAAMEMWMLASRPARLAGPSRTTAARKHASFALLAGVAVALSSVAEGAEWTFTPRVMLKETWTDNVRLAPSGAEESAWITELRPGFSLAGDGARIRAWLAYDLQALWSADRTDQSDFFHQLNSGSNIMLVRDSLFVDSFARYEQRHIDPTGRVAFSNVFDSENQTDAFSFGASPYHVGRWSNWGESLVRYEYRGTRYTNTDDTTITVRDVNVNTFSAMLGSPESARGATWRADGNYSRTEYDEGADFAFAQAALELGVPVGPRTRVSGKVGRESDVSEDQTKGGLDSTFWWVGVSWDPDARNSLAVRAGERYFGTTWGASYSRLGSRGSLELDYSEAPTTSDSRMFGTEGEMRARPPRRVGGSGALDSRVFLNRQLTGTARYELVRSVIAAHVFLIRRSFEDAMGGTDKIHGARIDYDWKFRARTTIGLKADWERRDYNLDSSQADLGDYEVRIRQTFRRTLTGELRAGHLRRTSNIRDGYSVNSVSLSITAVF